MAEKYSQRPSEFLNLKEIDPYAAFCFDEACFMWGSFVDSELDEASHDPAEFNRKEVQSAMSRRQSLFQKLLGERKPSSSRAEEEVNKGQFRDPVALFSK